MAMERRSFNQHRHIPMRILLLVVLVTLVSRVAAFGPQSSRTCNPRTTKSTAVRLSSRQLQLCLKPYSTADSFVRQPTNSRVIETDRFSLPISRKRDNNALSVQLSRRRTCLSLTSSNNSDNEKDASSVDSTKASSSFRVRNLILILLVVLTVTQRQVLLQTVASIKRPLQAWLVQTLDALDGAGMVGLFLYTLSFALWEMTAGITTPVETAAGMAFGLRKGLVANVAGKMGGALASFFLGRTILYRRVHKKFKNNEILQLVEESIQETPVKVALLVRLSPLPEAVKNYGLAVLPLRKRYFGMALLLHGLPFSILWTSLGAETSRLVKTGGTPSTTLKVVVSLVSWLGIVVSPTLIGLWIKGLRDKQIKRHEHDGDQLAN